MSIDRDGDSEDCEYDYLGNRKKIVRYPNGKGALHQNLWVESD